MTARQKRGLPSDTISNLKNNAHVMAMLTRSKRTLVIDIMNLKEDPNDCGVDEQLIWKRKQLDKSNEKVTIQNKSNIEKPRMVE